MQTPTRASAARPAPRPTRAPLRRLLARLTAAAALGAALAGCATTEPGLPEVATSIGLESALRLGDAAMAGGDNVAAARIYGLAAQDHPQDAKARHALADAYFRMGAWPEAAQAYGHLGALPGQRAAADTGLGRVALARGDAAEARRRFETALSAAPEDVVALNGTAVALDLMGRHAEAAGLYARVMQLDPTNRAAMSNAALSRALGGDPRGAARDLDELVNGPVLLPQARHNLALAYALSGDVAAASGVLSRELPPTEAAENLAFYQSLKR